MVTLHALLTDGTREMIGAAELALMRPGAFLVNCARAALVDHAALGEALRSGRLGGCALDVLPTEPPAADEPAFGWPRTLLNPHAAWYSPQSATAPYRMAGEAVAAVLEGREPYGALARPGLDVSRSVTSRVEAGESYAPASCVELTLGWSHARARAPSVLRVDCDPRVIRPRVERLPNHSPLRRCPQ